MFVDRIMTLGFQNACKAGISFGKDDLIVPDAKQTLVEETERQVKEFEQQYQNGLITKGENTIRSLISGLPAPIRLLTK